MNDELLQSDVAEYALVRELFQEFIKIEDFFARVSVWAGMGGPILPDGHLYFPKWDLETE